VTGREGLDQFLEQAQADGRLSTDDADTVCEFAGFLRAAGPPDAPGLIEVLREYQQFLGLSDDELAHAERTATRRADAS